MKTDYKLKFTPEANMDLFEIFEYVTNNLSAPVAAGTLIDKIEDACKKLVLFPLSGSIPRDNILVKKDYRLIAVDNFIVFYQVDDRVIRIMRIVYGKRNYQALL